MVNEPNPKRIKNGHKVDLSQNIEEAPAQDAINLRGLYDFFDSYVPTCVADPDHRTSHGTRGPKRFDQHLHTSLRLDKVRCRPTLGDDLKKIADDALTSYLHKYHRLPSVTGKSFPTRSRRDDALEESPHKRIIDESCVQHIYRQTTARHCVVVAATLEFQLPEWSKSQLVWEISAPPGTNKEAIADGYLKLKSQQLSDSYRTTQKILGAAIGIWEFKSLLAGDIDTFRAVQAHANKDKFPWAACPHEATGLCGMKCRSDNKDDTSLTRWCRLGPDANPSIFPDRRTSLLQDQSFDVNSLLKTGRDILQQIYAEMVVHDVTFACLNAGSNELIVERERDTRTLFISNILRTDVKGYRKLHTGLLIAMLRDARQRALQINIKKPATWTSVMPDMSITNFVRATNEQQYNILDRAIGREWLVMDTPFPVKDAFPFHVAEGYKRVRLSDSLTMSGWRPPCFDQLEPFLKITTKPNTGIDCESTLRVDGEEFTGALGISKHLVVKHATCFRGQKARLLWEFVFYDVLQRAGVDHIPLVFGLFEHATLSNPKQTSKGWMTLVMENVGRSLNVYRGPITDELKEDCRMALKLVHLAGVLHNNLELGHIIVRPHGSSTRIAFIGFGRATLIKEDDPSRVEELKRIDLNQLETVLDKASNGRKRKGEEEEDNRAICFPNGAIFS